MHPEQRIHDIPYQQMRFEAHAAKCILLSKKKKNRTIPVSLLLSKNRAMPVHAGTQRWILDGVPISLTFTVLCIPIPLKKHATM